MQSRETLRRHAALVDDMAQARGIDLEEQIMRGKLTVSELEDAVLRCTACTSPETCAHWLGNREDTAAETPAFCRNSGLFSSLDAG
ncbi:hypothetical protein KZZ07_00715 [Mameliella sp. CS4]|uniref:DUF6455 family protein n=1 Tax=Mameliella sp. CS4 TaxID=2862329 RepID=UPI001C5E7CEA|nr:DUF6455 family protein [Mameliella sp. CS4]MBW4981049.1 hypothetical protein [Mameliella sp. CS4]